MILLMSEGAKMTWSARVGLAILFSVPGACLAEPQAISAATVVAPGPSEISNPYSVISERNVFRLNPPPPPPEPEKGPPPVLPEVLLNGFMRTGDQWMVLLSAKVDNPDVHGHPLIFYLTLAEGDKKTVGVGAKQAEVQLVKAYADLGKIDIINAGTLMTLSKKETSYPRTGGSPKSDEASITRMGSVVLRRGARPKPIPDAPSATATMPGNTDSQDNAPGAAPDAGAPTVAGTPIGSPSPSDVTPSAPPDDPNNASTIVTGGAAGTPR